MTSYLGALLADLCGLLRVCVCIVDLRLLLFVGVREWVCAYRGLCIVMDVPCFEMEKKSESSNLALLSSAS